MSEKFMDWAFSAAVVLLFAAIPFGLGMALYTGDIWWLWFCAPIVIFLS